ncbi:tellurium resistance protein TerD [Frankineae bacterium MT45]|nr:tellurium resistance protein TerD [Frankineae bacterium MT45]
MATMMRGANVSLTREIPSLSGVVLGISWDAGSEAALADNLVVAALLCDANQRVLSAEHFVFFNQLASPELSVSQLEQALGGDDEQIEVALNDVPAEVSRIVVILYVNEGSPQRRTLGQLRHCTIRVLNRDGNAELVRSEDLAATLGGELAASLGELYRRGDEWKFKVLGQGYSKGIAGLAADYGLTL